MVEKDLVTEKIRNKFKDVKIKGGEDIKDLAQKVVTSYLEEKLVPEEVINRVISQFDQYRDTVMADILGLKPGWAGRGWEVDHCNGRMSEVRDYVQGPAKEAVKKWVDANIKTFIKKFSKDPGIRKAFEDEFRQVFKEEVSKKVYSLACEAANSYVAGATENILHKVLGKLEGGRVVDGPAKTTYLEK